MGDSVIPKDSKFQNCSKFGSLNSGGSTLVSMWAVELTPVGGIPMVLTNKAGSPGDLFSV